MRKLLPQLYHLLQGLYPIDLLIRFDNLLVQIEYACESLLLERESLGPQFEEKFAELCEIRHELLCIHEVPLLQNK